VHTLLRHPRALAGLRDGAVPSERVVEECLRFEPPVFGVLRRARVPVTLRGRALRRGDEVVVMLAAANRDGACFREPQRFDPARAQNPHLTFGFGPHYCPGAALAAATTRVALEVLAARGPRRPAGAPAVRWRDHDPIVRGPKELRIDLGVL